VRTQGSIVGGPVEQTTPPEGGGRPGVLEEPGAVYGPPYGAPSSAGVG